MKYILFLLLCCCSCRICASTLPTDSASYVQEESTTKFRPKQLILPASLITVGALGASIPALKDLNCDVKRGMSHLRGDHYLHFDDYLQYLPIVSHFGLSLLGAKAKHSYVERIMTTATAYALMGVMVQGVKAVVKERRPDSNARNSFPSGHTATAFMGAELVRMEYRDASPFYGIGAYTVACGVAFLRIYNERHWCNDVLAGAGLGILSARMAHWLLPFERKLFGLDKRNKQEASFYIMPFHDTFSGGTGAMLSLTF